MESVGVAINTNAAYELVKHADTTKEEGRDYELVGQRCPPVIPPPLMSKERKG